MASWLFLGAAALVHSALAAPPTQKSESMDVQLAFLGVGEVWQDTAIIDHYRSSRFGGSGVGTFGLTPLLAIEIEGGYLRMPSRSDREGVAAGELELIPLSLGGVVRKNGERAELFAGLGYAMTVFSERTDVGTVAGAKPGTDIRAGVKVHTAMVSPSGRPNGPPGVQGMDVELLIGRRQHHAFGVGDGLDFSAWRAGAGLVARF